MKRVLIVGIGNILLQDEGVGVRAVETMQGMDVPPDVELLDGGTSGADLVDYLADRAKVIVIDAVDSHAAPGTVFRMTPEDLVKGENADLSLHQLGLIDSLTMAREMGTPAREVVIYGIQPQRVYWGLELTEPVARVLPKVIEMVLREALAGAEAGAQAGAPPSAPTPTTTSS
jgi:hydrogenase maturation protease